MHIRESTIVKATVDSIVKQTNNLYIYATLVWIAENLKSKFTNVLVTFLRLWSGLQKVLKFTNVLVRESTNNHKSYSG